MALTPLLNEVGRRAAGIIDERSGKKEVCNLNVLYMSTLLWLLLWTIRCLFSQKPAETVNYGATEPIVILGFGEMGQVSCMHDISSFHCLSISQAYHICVGPCKISICSIIIWAWPRHRRMAICCIWSKSCSCKGEQIKKLVYQLMSLPLFLKKKDWCFFFFFLFYAECVFRVWLSLFCSLSISQL